jgi:two-component system response regulator AtoC
MSYVLLVDDDVDGREPLARLLEHRGYEVHCASNGHTALQSTLSRVPDVIVLDLFMPRMDGVKFLEVLRSYLRLQNLRVVVLTAFPESPLVKEARALGVTQILAKSKADIDVIDRSLRAVLADQPCDGAGGAQSYFNGC